MITIQLQHSPVRINTAAEALDKKEMKIYLTGGLSLSIKYLKIEVGI